MAKCIGCGKRIGAFGSSAVVFDKDMCEQCYVKIQQSYEEYEEQRKIIYWERKKDVKTNIDTAIQNLKQSVLDADYTSEGRSVLESILSDREKEFEEIIAKERKEHKRQLINEQRKVDLEPFIMKAKSVADCFFISEESRQWVSVDQGFLSDLHMFNEIISYKIVNDGQTIDEDTFSAALAGGMLFGVVGAIFGTVAAKESTEFVNDIRIIISLNNVECAKEEIRFLPKPVARGSLEHKKAAEECEEVAAMLEYIIDNNKQANVQKEQPSYSPADEVRKFQELYREGIITEEEFIEFKKRLLSKL